MPLGFRIAGEYEEVGVGSREVVRDELGWGL